MMDDTTDKKEPIDAMEEQELFIREFIATYKESPMLWDPGNPDYRNRTVRKYAYDKLMEKCKQYMPDVNEDYVKTKIDSMRSSFRREYMKVTSRKDYKPTLWYFSLLMFLVENDDEKVQTLAKVRDRISQTAPLKESTVKLGFWTREYSAILIDIFKKYKCVYLPKYTTHRYKAKREQAMQKITVELMEATNRKFKVADVKKKIQMLRGQFRMEFCRTRDSQTRGQHPPYKSPLWCYHLLTFLSSTVVKSNKIKKSSASMSDENSADDALGSQNFKTETDDDMEDEENCEPIASPSQTEDRKDCDMSDDLYDTIAKNVAHKLRDMTTEQRNIAQKILNDLMYFGQMEELTSKSRLSLNGK